MRYFVAGNFWLFVSLALLVGREYWRSSYRNYSFFGIGGPLGPFPYNLLILITAALGIWMLVRSSREYR